MFAGVDIGSLTAEAVIIKNGKIAASEIMSVLPHPSDTAREIMGKVLARIGARLEDIQYTVSTGYGRETIQSEGVAQENVSEISCHGLGAYTIDNSVRTIIDIGGQDAKVIKVDSSGNLVDFVMNDKCAAGTGHFLEVMSRTLGVTLDELGRMSLKVKKAVQMSTRCTIYVETEVIHYLQRGVPHTEVAAGINRAMAERALALVRRVTPEREVMLTGGVAKNAAVREELQKLLDMKLVPSPLDPQLMGAYGAAVFARKMGGGA